MSKELDLGCAPSDFADLAAKRRIIADGDWISASEARALLSQGRQDDEGKPTDAICLHAKHGEIQAKARRWITIENGQRYEKPDELIPRDFWADRDMRQDWSHGDFVSTVYPDDAKFEIEALGVTFERSGIVELASQSAPVSGTVTVASGKPTAKAERECEAWLREQFAADPEKLRAKASFQDDALAHFGERLSQAGFRRVWTVVAREDGRTAPGRKS